MVVAAHSQGSVLAYCALIHLAGWRKDITENVALVTFGSPLHRMHAKYFPSYFRQNKKGKDFDCLIDHLFKDRYPCTGWRNFYHRTDYVGQEVLVGTKESGCDCELPDPAKRRSYARRSVRKSWAVPADQPEPIFTRTLVHSDYYNSIEVRAWIRRVEKRLSR